MKDVVEIIIILLFSAFFSGMEIAFVSSSKLRFELTKERKTLANRALTIFFRHPNDFISTLLIGNNIALVIYGIKMARLMEPYLYALGLSEDSEGLILIIQTILSTLIVLVTGEFLPKTLFKINPNKSLNLLAIPAFVFYILLYPAAKFTSALSKALLRMLGYKSQKKTGHTFSKTDLDDLIQNSIDHSENEEEIEEEVKFFQNALDFPNVKVRDCMVPRTEIVATSINTTIDELKSRFIESGISKIIVYRENIDDIVGFIHSSEMFHRQQKWQEAIRPLPIVPETMAAKKLMKLFMQEKKSIAVVVDEFGGTSGIVSLEDIVEEIFGEIEDEHDNSNYVAKKLHDNEYLLSARLEIEKVNEMFELDIPESDEYMTIGGYILNKYQSFPKLNELVTIDNFQFKIVKNTTTKIELVQLKVLSE
jgi:CBS domain containing-hemolysin-like protein